MTKNFRSIGDIVYFINDHQKIDAGGITEICFKARKTQTNYPGWCKEFIYEEVSYVILGRYKRDESFVFSSREELINSL